MKKYDKPVWYVFLMCCAVLCFPPGMFCEQAKQQRISRGNVPSIIDVQRGLVETGYDIGPHGIDGRLADCDTVRAWNKYQKEVLFNKYAAKFMTASGGPKERSHE